MKRMILTILAMMILMLSISASAETMLSAYYENGTLNVQWSPNGDGVLTIYRAGWPISVCSVSAESNSRQIYVGEGDNLSVELVNESGCQRVDVEWSAAPTVSPQPTLNVTPSPTVEATLAPTVLPTQTIEVSNGGQSMTSMAAQVISEVNEERAKAGLSPLTMSAELTGAACVRANEIVEVFSHTRPDGTKWSTVSSMAYGENIAKGQRSAEHVMAAWMSSQGHRENILRASYGSIGVCALKVDGVIYWVQLFGK